jgi:type IV secretory pathway TrbD component
MLTVVDIGFVVLVLVPGYLPWVPAGIGPGLWVLAVVFTTIGLYGGKQQLQPAAT